MSKFKLTFNKPAARQFLDGHAAKGLLIKIEDGVVMFSPTHESHGKDVATIGDRTRGGYEAVVEGYGATKVLKALKNPDGPFFTLRRVSKDWVVAEAWDGKNAPPKLEPHARLWTNVAPKRAKKVEAEAPAIPAPVAKKAGAAKAPAPAPIKVVAQDEGRSFSETGADPLHEIDEAYAILAQPRMGRPSKAIIRARHIRDGFEQRAKQFLEHRSALQ